MSGALLAAAAGVGFGVFQATNARALRGGDDPWASTLVQVSIAAVQHAMSDAKVRERMSEAGVFPVTSKSPEEFKTYLDAEAAKWSRVVKETGAQPD